MATPPIVTEAFAKNAASGYITNPIPLTTATAGAASFDQGFPAGTMQPVVSGGVPPFGQDMNGILFMMSSHTAFLQSGQWYQFDAGVAAAIGGYAVGTILSMADGSGFWLSIAAANSANPDTGGAGWAALYSHGVATLAAPSSGVNVPVSTQNAAKAIIVVNGTLTGNLQYQLPQASQEWLIVNNMAGAFALTFTMLGSASAVTIVPGGPSQPTGIWGDGTNLYIAYQPPAALSISQAATPLTIAQRTSAGYLLATYLNQNSALENPSIGAFFVQNTAADGFLRKISPANLIAQLTLATTANIAAAIAPLATTAAVAAAIAALTTSGSNANGYWVKHSSGLIEQWAQATVGGTTFTNFTFPIAFTTVGSISVQLTPHAPVSPELYRSAVSTTGFTTASGAGGIGFSWTARGY